MKKSICLLFVIGALLLTACVYDGGSDDYEFPTGGAITTESSEKQSGSESSTGDDTTVPTDESTTSSEIPNDPDDGYSKRY